MGPGNDGVGPPAVLLDLPKRLVNVCLVTELRRARLKLSAAWDESLLVVLFAIIADIEEDWL